MSHGKVDAGASPLTEKLSAVLKGTLDSQKPLYDFDADRRQVVTYRSLLETSMKRAGFGEMGNDLLDVCFKVAVEIADARVRDVANRADVEIKMSKHLADTHIQSMRDLMGGFTKQLRPFLEATSLQANEVIVSVAIKQADGGIRIVTVGEE